MKVGRLFFAAALMATVATGCGPDPVNRSETGALEASDTTHPADGSFYDEYTFKAKEGWVIQLTMTSTEFAPYLQLRMQDQGDVGLVEQPAEGNSSVLSHTAPQTTTYLVWANSMAANETGAYTLQISAQPPAGQE